MTIRSAPGERVTEAQWRRVFGKPKPSPTPRKGQSMPCKKKRKK